jgi:multidrug resistance efflux pump
VKVLDACRHAGIANITIATAEEDNQPGAKVASKLPGKTDTADPTAEIARIKLEQAERELERINELHHQKLVSASELERAQAEVDVRKAELAGDSAAAMRSRLQQAERDLERLTQLNAQKLVSQQELDRAKFDVELRRAELAGDPVQFRLARLRQARHELERLSALYEQKVVSQQELDRAKTNVDLRTAEFIGDRALAARAALKYAEAELERASKLRAEKLISDAEYAKLRSTVEVARIELEQATAEDTHGKVETSQRLDWQPFSPDRLGRGLDAGQPVFIEFTADWSVAAQANEIRVLNSAAVSAALKKRNVLLLKADWTRGDKVITEWLQKLDKSSVPVYALYIPGKAEPHVFPELLTEDLVLKEIGLWY